LILPALYFAVGDRPISKIQEVRIAETSREMVVSGDWIVPRYNGELRLQKPPLPYWLTAASYKLSGVNAMAARVPAVLFSLLTAILMFIWISRTSSLKTAANVVLVLVASYIGVRYGRSGEADVPLMFFITLAAFYSYQILQGNATRLQVVLFYVGLGLGFLTKGPAGVAIPLLTVFLSALLTKRFQTMKALWSFAGLLLFLLLALGWYGWILWRMPDIAQHFFNKQVDDTFIAGTHAKPVWWYLAHAFEFYAPWGFLLIPAGFWAYKHRPLPAIVQFALIWLGVVFVLLTFTVNKQMQYALLFAPPIAIFIGHYLESASAMFAISRFAKVNRVLFYLFCAALLGFLVFLWRKHVTLDARGFWLLGIAFFPLAFKRLLKAESPSYPILFVAAMTSSVYVCSELYVANEAEKSDVPSLMAQIKDLPDIYQAKPGDGAVSYYAGRIVQPLDEAAILVLLAKQQEVLVVAKEAPEVQGVAAEASQTVGQLSLWKLKSRP
jgi:4-amino-4-deoxy-L-arabinose transferase-like glycosyltransferase